MNGELKHIKKNIKLENINQNDIHELIATAKKFALDNSSYLEYGEKGHMKYHSFLDALNKIVFDYIPKYELITAFRFNVHFDFDGNAVFDAHIKDSNIAYKPYTNMKDLASFIASFLQGKIPDFNDSDYTILNSNKKYDLFNYDDSVFIYITDLTDLVNGYYPDVLAHRQNKLLDEFIYHIRDMLYRKVDNS